MGRRETVEEPEVIDGSAVVTVGNRFAVGCETQPDARSEITARTVVGIETADHFLCAAGDIQRKQSFVIVIPSKAVQKAAVSRERAAVGMKVAEKTLVLPVERYQVLAFVVVLDPIAAG